MSRIIKSIINNVLGTDRKQYIYYHNNTLQDLEIAQSIGGEFLVFQKNQTDLNNYFKLVTDKQVQEDLNILPAYIINSSFLYYKNAKNLSELLKIPLVNIINDITNIKKEAIFSLANIVDQDINILFKKELAAQLYITNFTVVNNIKDISNKIQEKLKIWKPM